MDVTMLPMVDLTRRAALVTLGTMAVAACGRPKWLSDRARGGDRMDAVASSPQGLSVRFENDRVRVLELRLQPGAREGMHTHPQYVLYALTDYRVKNTNADGTVRVFERKRGDVFWGEPVTHGGENVGETEVHAVIVELKQARTTGSTTRVRR